MSGGLRPWRSGRRRTRLGDAGKQNADEEQTVVTSVDNKLEYNDSSSTPSTSPSSSRRQSSASTPPRPASTLSPVSRVSEVPVDDTQFVRFLRDRIRAFEALHVVEGVPLTDPRIATIRQELESNMPRLTALCEDAKGHKIRSEANDTLIFAQNSLAKFPDYKPAPPRRRRSSTVPYNSAPTLSAAIRTANTLMGPSPARSMDEQCHGDPETTADLTTRTPRPEVTTAQQNLLQNLFIALAPTTRQTQALASWWEPPFATLPPDLVSPPVHEAPLRVPHAPSPVGMYQGRILVPHQHPTHSYQFQSYNRHIM